MQTPAKAQCHYSNLVNAKWKHFALTFIDGYVFDVVDSGLWFLNMSNHPGSSVLSAQCLEAIRLSSIQSQKKILIVLENKSALQSFARN